jgi:large subunit ribosomal protein L17
MRHAKRKYKLSRSTSLRKATLRALARALLLQERIKTTKAKAKAVRRLAEYLISLGKKNDLSSRRQAYRILGDHQLVKHLFSEIAVRFANRQGGYTRLMEWVQRRGDNAQMAILELTEIKKSFKKKEEKKKEEKKPPKEKGAEEVVRDREEPVMETPEKAAPEKKETAAPPERKKKPEKTRPGKKFFGGLRTFFKKERDSL